MKTTRGAALVAADAKARRERGRAVALLALKAGRRRRQVKAPSVVYVGAAGR